MTAPALAGAMAPPSDTRSRPDPGFRVMVADHPSLDAHVDRFVAEVRSEQRRFGPTASRNPKPFRSLIDSVAERPPHDGSRVAAVENGRVIGLARIDGCGELSIVVSPDRRGVGVGTALARAAAERALALGLDRITVRTTRRNRATRRIGEALGCRVVHRDRGRTDLVVDLRLNHRADASGLGVGRTA